CPASYAGAGGLSGALTPTYTENVNVGTAIDSAADVGRANHDGSLGSDTFEITRAPSTTTVDCPVSQVYTGSAIEPCTASYSGAGGLTGSLTPTYTDNVNVGTATASAAYGGDANHDGSLGSDTFEITPAPSTTTVTCPVSEEYTGSAIEPCTASYSGAGGLSGSLTPTYTDNLNVGTAHASAAYAGAANSAGSTHTATGTITRAPLDIYAVTDTKIYDAGTSSSGIPSLGSGQLQGSDTVTGRSQAFLSKNVMGTNSSTLAVIAYTVN